MRALRTCVLSSAGAAVVSLMFVCLRAAENQPAAAKAPDLQQRVSVLEDKVARLEKQLAEQAQQGYQLAVPPGVAAPQGARPAPVVPQAPPSVPPNAVPHTFNGQTFYIVPLGKKEGAR